MGLIGTVGKNNDCLKQNKFHQHHCLQERQKRKDEAASSGIEVIFRL
jgi:hypothetical protein